jgi:uncharacterized SAM-binding protein YcdF (DUF218 family)
MSSNYRVKKTLKLYNKNKNLKIIVTGGVAQNGITESHFMKTWLVENGVPSESIYIEDRARSTIENAYYSLIIAKILNLDNITQTRVGSARGFTTGPPLPQ